MSLNIVDLENAKRLKKLGYPQDEWPQMVWRQRPLSEMFWAMAEYWDRPIPDVVYCAAPDYLTVLDWLEREKGWKWGKNGWDGGERPWYIWNQTFSLEQPTTIDLVSALCERCDEN